jgi:hypothetical protein
MYNYFTRWYILLAPSGFLDPIFHCQKRGWDWQDGLRQEWQSFYQDSESSYSEDKSPTWTVANARDVFYSCQIYFQSSEYDMFSST